jgi:hypothetical protein
MRRGHRGVRSHSVGRKGDIRVDEPDRRVELTSTTANGNGDVRIFLSDPIEQFVEVQSLS